MSQQKADRFQIEPQIDPGEATVAILRFEERTANGMGREGFLAPPAGFRMLVAVKDRQASTPEPDLVNVYDEMDTESARRLRRRVSHSC